MDYLIDIYKVNDPDKREAKYVWEVIRRHSGGLAAQGDADTQAQALERAKSLMKLAHRKFTLVSSTNHYIAEEN